MASKRSVAEEKRKFNPDWTQNYFFVEEDGEPLCLVCKSVLSVLKGYNLRRHYETKHSQEQSLSVSERSVRRQALEASQCSEQQLQTEKDSEKATNRASFLIAQKIASSGRPFTDGVSVKECSLIITKSVCPESYGKFSGVALSRRTVSRRIRGIAENLEEQLIEKSSCLEWWSIAMDESTDMVDTAQLLVFIRAVDSNMEIIEELMRARLNG
ncbi:EPM2A-interacting protein 1-like [Galendromus occidentalis]|uniref:EPM2A-interacting protein 1-like n=1 Tax=Galendromus occidentalis TaxID=34638 RepID=A0AAJ6VWJ9_9ACAR|nr:EPM2A-interacting protein 1-like [Galendromus occidentalis]